MWLKFCGITRPVDFSCAVELGVEAVGIIIVPSSPRCVSAAQLLSLARLPRASTKLVLVSQDQSRAELEAAIEILQPDLLQFHGSEPVEFALSFELPYIKALRIADPCDEMSFTAHTTAWAWLLDRATDTGERADSSASAASQIRKIEAGMLTAETVSERLRITRPYGVDVSRGIESAPGIKDIKKMSQFVKRVRDFEAL